MKEFRKFLNLSVLLVILLSSCKSSEDSKELNVASDLLEAIDATLDMAEEFSDSEKEDLLFFQPFQNPPEIRSQDGKLFTKLDVKFATNKIYHPGKGENVDVYHRSYNGKLVGTTWRIKRGDLLEVAIDNQLADSVCKSDPLKPKHDHDKDHNVIDPARFNTTNLHVHGFHVSPSDSADNVFIEIKAGCQFQNRYKLPQDHAQGTFWYHGHVHGSTAIQAASGMAGAIIIEGGLDEQPQIKAMEENIFVLQQMPFMLDEKNNRYHIPFDTSQTGNFGFNRWHKNAQREGWSTTINGQSVPIITMAPGEVQRWRFIHAGVRETVNLHMISQEITNHYDIKYKKHNFHAIAEDGIAYGRMDKKDSMELQPGYRADLLVKAPEVTNGFLYLLDGKSELLGTREDTDELERPKLLAIVELKDKGSNVAKKLPSQASLGQFAPYKSLVNTQTTVAEENMRFYINTEYTPPKFGIDSVPFDPKNIRCLKKDAIQDWHLSSGLGSHPFHIHVNHFQVLGKMENGRLRRYENPVWKDTYMVNADDTTVIRTVYKTFTGKFVIHCHILDHEDQGMMQSVKIVDDLSKCLKPAPLSAGITVCGSEEKPEKAVPPD